jgi:hypothetical protein
VDVHPDYQKLLDDLNLAEERRHDVVRRFREKAERTKGFDLEFDVIDPLFDEWSETDAGVAAAREAIRAYIRRRLPRYTQGIG